jgi:AAT family amino acid transporter
VFSALDFVSFYVEIPVMLVMSIGWMFAHRVSVDQVPAVTLTVASESPTATTPLLTNGQKRHGRQEVGRRGDLVDHRKVDLVSDEYADVDADKVEDEERERRVRGRARWAWRVYYLLV